MLNDSQKKKYLSLSIKLVKKQLKTLKLLSKKNHRPTYDKNLKRELKSTADKIIEKDIVKNLLKTNISILSEEIGSIKVKGKKDNSLKWIIDPLDGTVNFIRNLGSCSISIALFSNKEPIFGVVGIFPSEDIFYGGRHFGSYSNNKKIKVSMVKEKSKAVICTGFPSRYNFKNENFINHMNKLKSYFKVRMLGSASVSLVQVAKGSADIYFESDIMIWDIAAGMAILEGAGGEYNLKKGRKINSYVLTASNHFIKII